MDYINDAKALMSVADRCDVSRGDASRLYLQAYKILDSFLRSSPMTAANFELNKRAIHLKDEAFANLMKISC